MTLPASKQPADQLHRDRAVSDLDTSFLVEAAAGTGKTTLLVSRIMALLRGGKARLGEIAAITFTEKAAGELKVRLREEIESALREEGDVSEFRDALADLDSMTVGTIHSFCADLIRERPVEAGVEPGFGMADELTSAMIFQETWDAWLAGEMVPENRVLRRAIEHGVTYADNSFAPSQLVGLAKSLMGNRDRLDRMALAPAEDECVLVARATEIRNQIAFLSDFGDGECVDAADKGMEVIRSLAAWSDKLPLPEFDALPTWLAAAPTVKSRSGRKDGWSSPASLKRMRDGLEQIKETIESLQRGLSHRILSQLVEWLNAFLARYDEAKSQRCVLDFQDLLIIARTMLRDSKVARNYFKSAWRYLLVDEFQDTDPLQTEIVFFLCEQFGEHEENWESVKLIPGKLFLVGDPKQSIYSFRRADLDLYGRVKEVVGQQGDLLNLSVNFRTAPEILNEINRVFRPLMTGPTDKRYEPDHVDLIGFRETDGRDVGVRILPPPELDAEGFHADEWRRAESGAIAAAMKELVAAETPIFDKDAKAWRPVCYRDMGVVMRAMTGLESLESALRAHDVPYQIAGGKHYYARTEFQDLLNVLRAVENPFDGLSVVAAMRSPFFGYSDEELLRHFAAKGSWNYLEPLPDECAILGAAFETLKMLHSIRNRQSIPSVLGDLFERTQALHIYAMKPHGEQRVANLLKVSETARQLEELEPSSFGALVRWLTHMESTGQDEGESPVAEADEDCVQIMTFHKSKGLEFPVLFLAHLASVGNRGGSEAVDPTTGGLELKLGKKILTRNWEVASEDKKDREEHEARRLFYVALTRARDLLIIPATWSGAKDAGFLGYLSDSWLADGAPSDEMKCLSVSAEAVAVTANDRFTIQPELGPSLPPEAVAIQSERRAWQAALKARAGALNGARDVRLASQAVEDKGVAAEYEGPFDPTAGSVFGTLVHNVLERVDFARPDELEALADAEGRALDLPRESAWAAVDLVERALHLPLIRERVLGAKEHHKELPFTVDHNGALLEGRMDLVFLEEDGAVIVDYKTDRVEADSAGELADHYAPQGEVYMRALEAALDAPVKEMIFLFLRPGVAISSLRPKTKPKSKQGPSGQLELF
jgi:ATP-dependent helicase/nuclease subunit A